MACIKFIRECFQKSLVGHDKVVLSNLRIVEARPGYIKCILPIAAHNLNPMGTTHGGCVMSLVDTVTWLSMATVGLPEVWSVSTNMNCEFVRPLGREGDDLVIEGFTVQQGRRIAFTRVNFTLNGKLCGFGSHTQAVDAHQWTHKFSADGERAIPVEELEGASSGHSAGAASLHVCLVARGEPRGAVFG
ncbi:hypothetical protein CspeluHIS016_0301120 [Cutaneotrichosporon spelunceum]|uniref:Thioesterase domain-containing protein n=1 Tax=Cutaneotrichosporon spelunceum TaxID=1672016 RepID=A0AAD3YBU4_9TREE|nr:hypothetical protein CspeluHIS016_0301120 [Cutaneotrichosporon spelunceum]